MPCAKVTTVRADRVGASLRRPRPMPQTSMDKMQAWRSLGFDRMFVGDDWKGSDMWRQLRRSSAAGAWRSSTSRTRDRRPAPTCARRSGGVHGVEADPRRGVIRPRRACSTPLTVTVVGRRVSGPRPSAPSRHPDHQGRRSGSGWCAAGPTGSGRTSSRRTSPAHGRSGPRPGGRRR